MSDPNKPPPYPTQAGSGGFVAPPPYPPQPQPPVYKPPEGQAQPAYGYSTQQVYTSSLVFQFFTGYVLLNVICS